MSGSEQEPATDQPRRSAVDRVLEAAGRILDEEGLPGFNTNAIAKRAGINVATLYHHFEDKNDVLLQLAERIEGGRIRFFAGLGAHPDLLHRWEEMVRVGMTELHRHRRDVPGARGIRRAVAAVPEAAAKLEEYVEHATSDVVRLFATFGPVDERRARVVATVVIEAASAVLDHAAFHSTDPETVIDEGVRLVIAYISSVFGVPPDLSGLPPAGR